MSADINSVLPHPQLPEVAKDVARQSSDEVKEFAQVASDTAKDAAREVKEVAGDVTHATKDVVKHVSDSAMEIYHSAAHKAQDTFATSQQYVRRNPITFVLGSVVLGAAIGYMIINARRRPSFGERFVDEPMYSMRDAIRGAFSPVAHRVHEGYDSAREGVEKVMDQVHRLRPSRAAESLSDRIGRAAHNLKFW